MTDQVRRLAVLGSPIAHSKSPALHQAAYLELGLPWEYESIEVQAGALSHFVNGLDKSWLGLSLTMPLKREVLPLLGKVDDAAAALGVVNTVLLRDRQLIGFNTDVFGVASTLIEAGIVHPRTVRILGAGATAASVIAAVHDAGAEYLEVCMRSPEKAEAVLALSHRLGLNARVGGFDGSDWGEAPDVVVSTLPGDTPLVRKFSETFRLAVPLVDISYDPWPTAIAQHWLEAEGTVTSGLTMLVFQALAQVRIFVNGDPTLPLPDEKNVLAAMRAAVGMSTVPIVGG